MHRILSVIALLLLCAFMVGAQAIDVSKLDFSQARVSMAGPDKVYVRSVLYDGQTVSVILTWDGSTGATIDGPFTEGKFLQDSDEVAYATITPSSDNTITISPVIVDGKGYSIDLQWTPGSNQLTMAGELRPTDLPATYHDLAAAVEQDKAQIATLDDQLTSAQQAEQQAKANADNFSQQAADAQSSLQAAQARADGLSQQLADEQAKTADLTSKLQSAASAAAQPAASAAPEEVAWTSVETGFGNGKALFGTWKAEAGGLTQTDTNLKFAKYSIPVSQGTQVMEYDFTANTAAKGWVGYGLHIYASGEKAPNGYGLGSSYLVWLTRDTAAYKTGKAFVQLYEATSDLDMIQLASAAIADPIDSQLTTSVQYDPLGRTIRISVNGAEWLSYNLESPLTSGESVALRTLGGPVEFVDLQIRTR